jgi:two-component system, NarL family, nitrate/nitrite response regulator NarL
MPSIACVVVHPSPIFREGLTSILAKSPFKPVCTASSAKDVPSTVAGAGEQVLVLIGARDDGNLAEALIAAKARFSEAHIVVVGDSGQRDLVTTALASGATSFIDQNVATSTLIKELELMAQGEPVISVLLLKRLLGFGNGSAPPSVEAVPPLEIDKSQPPDTDEEARPNPQLSGREAAILNALVQGTPNKLIALGLKITEATVKVHVKAILRKIRVTNRTQAAIWALRHPAVAVVDAPAQGADAARPKSAGRDARGVQLNVATAGSQARASERLFRHQTTKPIRPRPVPADLREERTA